MSKAAPAEARRWLGEEMMRWAEWVKHEDNISISPYPSLVGWLVGATILSDEELAQLNVALGYQKPDPV